MIAFVAREVYVKNVRQRKPGHGVTKRRVDIISPCQQMILDRGRIATSKESCER